jgi:hypothetical protein
MTRPWKTGHDPLRSPVTGGFAAAGLRRLPFPFLEVALILGVRCNENSIEQGLRLLNLLVIGFPTPDLDRGRP